MKSLRGQLSFFWALLATVCVALGFEMWVLYRSSAGVQVDAARNSAQTACNAIAGRYARSLPEATSSATRLDLLHVVLHLVLSETPHVEGGVWSANDRFVAYAYPTYEGTSVKRDVPEAEQGHIGTMAALAAQSQRSQTDVVRASREALIVSACPLASPDNSLVAWTMTRTPTTSMDAQDSLRSGLGVLLALVLSSGVWLGVLLIRGYRHVHRIERQLDSEVIDRMSEPITKTGLAELDRVVAALNRMRARYAQATGRLRDIERQQARDQRLAALGRMIGAIAHEIRNPIAAMRLKAENALAGPQANHAKALATIVGQVERLDGLVQSLLAVVQPIKLELQPLKLDEWLDSRIAPFRDAAAARQVTIDLHAEAVVTRADPLHLGRAIDNLLDNALVHTRQTVTVSTHAMTQAYVKIQVTDDGPGVPEHIRDHLFEPFASGRRDGTGLGLALAREVAIAHGGELRYIVRSAGSCFEIEWPWHTS